MGELNDRVRLRLREFRESLGRPAEEVAELVAPRQRGAEKADKTWVTKRETGLTAITVDQLEAWAAALDANVEILIYTTPDRSEELAILTGALSVEDAGILRELAASLSMMPEPAKQALRFEAKSWRDASGQRPRKR